MIIRFVKVVVVLLLFIYLPYCLGFYYESKTFGNVHYYFSRGEIWWQGAWRIILFGLISFVTVIIGILLIRYIKFGFNTKEQDQ